MSDWRILANKWQKNAPLLSALLIIYGVAKIYFHTNFDTTNYDLAADFLVGLLGLFLFWDKFHMRWHWKHLGWVSIAFCLAAGWGFFATTKLGFNWLPFDYGTLTDRALLLVAYPIVEEVCYRFTLFWCLMHLFKSPWIAIVGSSLVFGMASSWESTYVPKSMQAFLYFKGFTLAVISCWWAYRYHRTGSLLVPIGLHFFFKLGFFIALIM